MVMLAATTARAHEVLPTVGDMTRDGDTLTFEMRLNLENFIAGIDQSTVADTNNAPQATDYDALRALEPAALEAELAAFWPSMTDNMTVSSGEGRLPLEFQSVDIPQVGNLEDVRTSTLIFTASLPEGAETASFGWAPAFGTLVLRQLGVENPYDGYLEAGAISPQINLGGGDQAGPIETLFNYIPVGTDHIVPKGLDHILFVLGLFFLSTKMGPLLWQISAFTLAHTITLALAALGYVTIPGAIVEPLIALSIVYVAIENLFTDGLSRWRPFIIFGFGLLHGLGFASVLAEFGLPQGSFVPALIGFNIGVELGQLMVIAVAYLCVYKAVENSRSGDGNRLLAALYLVGMVAVFFGLIPLADNDALPDLLPLFAIVAIIFGLCAASAVVARFDGYREIVAMPASILIAVVAAYWCVERVFL